MWQGIFLPKSTFSADSLTVSVQPSCAIACINGCVPIKEPKHWQPYFCLDKQKYQTHCEELLHKVKSILKYLELEEVTLLSPQQFDSSTRYDQLFVPVFTTYCQSIQFFWSQFCYLVTAPCYKSKLLFFALHECCFILRVWVL